MTFGDLKTGDRFFLEYLVEEDPDSYLPQSIEVLVKLNKPVVKNVIRSGSGGQKFPRAHRARVEHSGKLVCIDEEDDVIKLV